MISKSLMLQLAIIIVLIASGVLSCFGYYRYQIESDILEDQLQGTLITTTERLAISLRTPLYTFHEAGINDVMISELKNPDISGIYIVDPFVEKRKYWLSQDSNGNPMAMEEFPKDTVDIKYNLAIIHESEEIGEVFVFMSTERMDVQLEGKLLSILFEIIVLNILLIVFIILLLKVKVIRPIAKLKSVSQKIANGDLKQSIKIKGQDEIAQLAQSFNVMTVNLRESQHEIEEYSKNLESKVEERTRELGERNEELNEMNEELSATQIELHDLNDELEQRVKERTFKVEKLLQQKDDFINQLGHDLKTPLTPLNTLVPIIKKRLNDDTSEEMLDVISISVDRMNGLVGKTLELARLNSSKISFDFVDVNLFSEIKDDIKANKTLFDESNVTIKNMVDEKIVVKADKVRLGELFDNLVNNALKYTPETGGVITIDAKEEKNSVIISINDSGIGLTKEQIEHIFDEFYKVDEARHDLSNHGLGLSICKRIVEIHGGRIWAESPGLGRGSTFYFTLKAGDGKNN